MTPPPRYTTVYHLDAAFAENTFKNCILRLIPHGMYTKEPELCNGTEMLVVHQLMSEYNSQEASSPAQQGSPLSVTQHANNSLDEPVSDSNVSTTNHGLAAVEADDWVDEGEEIEVQWMSKGYYYYLLELRCTIEESVKIDCFDIFSALYSQVTGFYIIF